LPGGESTELLVDTSIEISSRATTENPEFPEVSAFNIDFDPSAEPPVENMHHALSRYAVVLITPGSK
jgi:hypothetical protein